MLPAQPPLPTAWNFPFQSAAGIQTSILMSESDEGVSVAATRQKVGCWLNCGAAGPVPGRVNVPAGTIWARVIEVFGSAKDDNLSHDDAALRAWPCVVSARRSAHDPPITIFISRSSEVPTRGQQDRIHSLHRENRLACYRRIACYELMSPPKARDLARKDGLCRRHPPQNWPADYDEALSLPLVHRPNSRLRSPKFPGFDLSQTLPQGRFFPSLPWACGPPMGMKAHCPGLLIPNGLPRDFRRSDGQPRRKSPPLHLHSHFGRSWVNGGDCNVVAEFAKGSRQNPGALLPYLRVRLAASLDESHSLMQDLPN